jgi:hypothetical protein
MNFSLSVSNKLTTMHLLISIYSPTRTLAMADADALAAKLATLTMNSNPTNIATRSGNFQNHTVTLPVTFDENIPTLCESIKVCERLSIDQMGVGMKSSRPSFDSHTQSSELSQHLLGHSPRISLGRPPKGTATSYRCSIDGADNGGSTRHGRTPNAENLCFITTYVRWRLMVVQTFDLLFY